MLVFVEKEAAPFCSAALEGERAGWVDSVCSLASVRLCPAYLGWWHLKGHSPQPDPTVLNRFLLSLYGASCSTRFIRDGDPHGVWPPPAHGSLGEMGREAGLGWGGGSGTSSSGTCQHCCGPQSLNFGCEEKGSCPQTQRPCPRLSALSLTEWPFPAPSF